MAEGDGCHCSLTLRDRDELVPAASTFAPLRDRTLSSESRRPPEQDELSDTELVTVETDSRENSSRNGVLAPHARLILALVIAATFLDVIDFSIVQVALPTIRKEFLAPLAELQWIIGAYGLTMAGFLMVSGRAGDIYGQKRGFVIGIVLFTIASLTAGLAPSLLLLVLSRAIQGVGAAITTATALAILAAALPAGRARNRALCILGAALSAGLAAGSFAGVIRHSPVGWG